VTDGYAAIVYDLDGTLVDLDVDWEAARRDAAAVLRARGIDTAEMGLWDVLEAAEPNGAFDRVNDAIAEHERAGARRARRLDTVDALPHDVPVGVCSLNSESACRIALELHGIDVHVDALVGRDTVETYKPDPAPLLETIRRIGAAPANAMFIGDSERDAVTADRAGVDYLDVADHDW
jgi:phosphoglycolate phosphatase